jgi:Flp pilus assembly protein TadG
MSRKVRQLRKGVAAVELAVLLPFLVTLFVIALDWGRIIYYTVTVNNCARNGAMWLVDQYSGVTSPYTNLTDAARADAPNLSPLPSVTDPPATGTDANGNSYKECTVTYNFKMITNFPGVNNTTRITRTVRVYPAPQAPN